MSAIFSTPRIFGLVLIGLMITSCGGRTSSNTSNGGGGDTSDTSNTTVTPPRRPPETLTITVPSLGRVATIDKNTSLSEINNARRDLSRECVERYIPFSTQANTCTAEVTSAYNQAIDFINR
jgi:hypothetical protein